MVEIPHRLFEGMAIAAVAVGASQGYIYLRAEYPYVATILEQALADARRQGLIGSNIMGSGVDFDIQLFIGAGSYVCGEETALLDSMEGKRGEPRFKPPFPGVQGLWGQPAIINNVETLSNLPRLWSRVGWFRSMGTERCPAPALYSLRQHCAPWCVRVSRGHNHPHPV